MNIVQPEEIDLRLLPTPVLQTKDLQILEIVTTRPKEIIDGGLIAMVEISEVERSCPARLQEWSSNLSHLKSMMEVPMLDCTIVLCERARPTFVTEKLKDDAEYSYCRITLWIKPMISIPRKWLTTRLIGHLVGSMTSCLTLFSYRLQNANQKKSKSLSSK